MVVVELDSCATCKIDDLPDAAAPTTATVTALISSTDSPNIIVIIRMLEVVGDDDGVLDPERQQRH